ncbi:NAD-dependent epimerase/dehydratase family protein [Roseivivax sediminis]|uniref:Nucleoside-diphosphate-sugar epimerase n=1 Tax=Roseivivax sediminis TaxID=936889 RepID=A0A1I1X287_9RHOB|nr:NAD-dependent epimerase/dehydratase family protein [Roseivivax sediminis]SFD99793.1 Nucleoside-diphosphate-sugar epimerase [Roseivivax sediminis]
MNDRTALVLGATGGIGRAIAGALLRHGWQVRGMARVLPETGPAGLSWVRGDAMRRGDVLRAASGTSAIVHAVNPPGYRDWDRLVLPMMENSLHAARVTGARILLPGTIYNYDPERCRVIDETTPQRPASRKGAIRAQMEAMLAAGAPGVPSIILRAGDFFGSDARSSWFSQAMVRPGRPLRRVVNPARGPGHSWAYLPDLAEAAARLLDAPGLRPFERLQFEGLYDATGRRLIDGLETVTGRPLTVDRFPWWLMHALAPVARFPREAADIAPFWRHPVRLDNSRLEMLIGPEPRTELEAALRATLASLGCLPGPRAPALPRPA